MERIASGCTIFTLVRLPNIDLGWGHLWIDECLEESLNEKQDSEHFHSAGDLSLRTLLSPFIVIMIGLLLNCLGTVKLGFWRSMRYLLWKSKPDFVTLFQTHCSGDQAHSI